MLYIIVHSTDKWSSAFTDLDKFMLYLNEECRQPKLMIIVVYNDEIYELEGTFSVDEFIDEHHRI